MSTSKSKNNQKKTNLILGILGGVGAVAVVIVLFITQPWKPDYLSGKYEKQFMNYTYDCMDFDELGDMSANSVISEIYGSWALVACTCSYLEYHNYYGDKDLPKTEVIISILPSKKKTIYDAASVFLDKHLTDNIKSCVEKEHDDWEAKYGDNFRKKNGYSL
ncbi:hypothetical protein IKG73_02030 [Candidatus Saccharibacteria bacterium]|nr:hypothetical protein [Candidatus Saccharibacteria bacterium]